jgi:hypothetical protein
LALPLSQLGLGHKTSGEENMTENTQIFDEKFDRKLEKIQRSSEGSLAISKDWRTAIVEMIELNSEQKSIILGLPKTSTLIIQRQFRKSLRNNSILHCRSGEDGRHTLFHNGDQNQDGFLVICDRRGDGNKCRWFPKDRNGWH